MGVVSCTQESMCNNGLTLVYRTKTLNKFAFPYVSSSNPFHPMSLLKSATLTIVALGALALPASADWHGRCHGGWGGPRVSVGIGFPLVVPAPYYAPAPYYYEPAPVVVAPRPVVVGREVAGDVVVDAQRALARRGYYNGVVDGELGPRSRAAIRAWQADCGYPVTGQLDARTLRSLALL